MNRQTEELQDVKSTRDRVIVRTSVVGILANLLLAGSKAAVGILANSIAVVLDAVNNLSDALSSVITIVGTKLAGRHPDKKHPLGYGRMEYLTAMIIAAIVLYAGVTSLVESVKKIIHPETADYSAISLAVIALAVVVKLVLGRYVKHVGQKVNSGSLVASGSDALSDALLSASVLASAVVYLLWNVSLEAWVGVVISVFIIRAGIEMLMETLDEILGKRMEGEYLDELRNTICEDPNVSGAYDLILHSYGPEKYIGSVHVEVPAAMTADEIDVMERRIAHNVFVKHGVIMTGIGIYSMNTDNDEIAAMRADITRRVMAHPGVLQIHGFYADNEKKTASFDVILDYGMQDRHQAFADICAEIREAYPTYEFQIVMDIDI